MIKMKSAALSPLHAFRRRIPRLIFLLLLAALLIAALKYLGEVGVSYDWQWRRLWRYVGHFENGAFIAGPILKGIGLTAGITALAGVLSAGCGIVFAAFRLSPWRVCAACAKLYVAFWRNTPLLLQLFMAYFLISPILHLTPFWTATLALALFEGAYFAEIFRAGILAVHKNQWEAALSLGFGMGETFLFVILPQAARNVLPAIGSQAVALLKDSSLVSAIAVADLTMQSQAVIAETFLAFEVWLLAGAVYLVLALFIALPALWLEKRVPSERRMT